MNFFSDVTYNELTLNGCKCRYHGVFIYKYKRQGTDSVQELLSDIQSGKIDFDDMCGSFRIIIEYPDGKVMFFGDNSNNCCFYYNENNVCFSDSFLTLCRHCEYLSINYESITQFIMFGCIYGIQMFYDEIKRTDSDNYYIFSNECLGMYSKKLVGFGELNHFDTFSSFFDSFIHSMEGFKIADVITGGVDSRMVLCNLLRCGVYPVAEEPGHIDAQIAQEISGVAGLPLHIISKDYAKDDILEDAFTACDGMFPPLSRYYLVLMRREIQKKGFDAVFGGVCGELYKNSFINQDFPFYGGNKNDLDKFYSIKIAASALPLEQLGEPIKECAAQMPEKIKAIMMNYLGNSKKETYFNIGYWIMKQRAVSISNAANNTVSFIAPLLERHALSIAFKKNPYSLEMQAFARKEVSEYSRAIAGIRTDRGLTCRDGALPMMTETVANYTFLAKLYFARKFKKNSRAKYINSQYFINSGYNENIFIALCEKLQNIGVLSKQDVNGKFSMNTSLMDKILMLGMVLFDDDKKKYK